MAPTRYRAAESVYLRMVNNNVVILDLRRDNYLALDQDTSKLLHPHLQLLCSAIGMTGPAERHPLSNVLRDLIERGLLSTSAYPHNSFRPLRLTEPHSAIIANHASNRHIRIHDAACYFASAITAAISLRLLSLHKIVTTERRRTISRRSQPQAYDSSLTESLCSIYSRLRIVIDNPQHCLFDSLALKRFLARYGLFPQWVFGVRLDPFAAHCWLQHETTVLNDSLDFVRSFTPIMTA